MVLKKVTSIFTILHNIFLAERENGFIFHQKIPDVLPDLGELKATHGLAAPDPYHIVEKRYVG